MRLFVDIDDTLILWPKVSEERHSLVSGSPSPNQDVIRFVQRMREFHCDNLEVIVWSLGGADYAAKHAKPLIRFDKAWDKSPIPVGRGDLFLDDDPLPFYREQTIHPDVLAVEE